MSADSITESNDSITESTDSITESTNIILESTNSITEYTNSITESADSHYSFSAPFGVISEGKLLTEHILVDCSVYYTLTVRNTSLHSGGVRVLDHNVASPTLSAIECPHCLSVVGIQNKAGIPVARSFVDI